MRFIVGAALSGAMACAPKESTESSSGAAISPARAFDAAASSTPNPAAADASPGRDSAPVPPDSAPDSSAPSARPSGHRCSENLTRAFTRIAKIAGASDGAVDDRSSADVVEIAYFIDDADIRLPQFALHIERDPSAGARARHVRNGVPSWFERLKPTAAMPIKWPDRHVELQRDVLRGTIVDVIGSKKVESALEEVALSCMRAWTP